MLPGRELFWNIQFGWIMYFLAAIFTAVLVYSIMQHAKRWRMGQPHKPEGPLSKRITSFIYLVIVELLLHRKFFRVSKEDPTPREFNAGIMHWLIFIGSLVFLAGTAIEAFSHYVWEFNTGTFYLWYSVIIDVWGILAIVGVILALWRRYVVKPKRLDNQPGDFAALLLIAVVIITGFLIEGLRIVATELNVVSWVTWSPIGLLLANALRGLPKETVLALHASSWWVHIVLVFGAVGYVTLTNNRLYHIIWDPMNIFLRDVGPRGALKPIDLEKAESFGVSKIEGFTSKQLLDLDACTRCGRCMDNCPANISGKKLNPKKVITDLKEHMYEVYPKPIAPLPDDPRKDMITDVITEEVIWDCTTCRACDEACPVYIDHIDKIIDMRRNLAMERSQFPESAQDALKSLGQRSHPFRGTTATRTDWTEGLNIKMMADDPKADILFWVGCTAALEERSQKTARATAKIMQAAGVNFAILGMEEACCGDPARRMGDEYLFQTLAQGNMETMKNYNVKKIVTSCPHCFNMLMKEYPQFGGNYEVIHHTQFILDLIREGKIKLNALDSRNIAYHDSCYLGRYNDIYQEPREILKSIGGIKAKELPRNFSRSFCCGGGGGHMWMEDDPDKRLNTRRIEEVIDTKVDTVATACPYCLVMFTDALKAKGVEETVLARDLAELVVESMEKGQAKPPEQPAK